MLRFDSISLRALLAGGLLWAAFPPLNWWPLATLSIAIYLSMIYPTARLSRREYFAIWLGASLCWLGLLQGIRLAYWPLYAGWIALSLYLAVYTVAFIGLARALVHRWRWPMVAAAPLAWMSLELARGYVITGFSSCLLGHVVVGHPLWIQSAAHLGAYAVSGSIVLSAVGLYFLYDAARGRYLRNGIQPNPTRDSDSNADRRADPRWQIALAGLMLIANLGYGYWESTRSQSIADANLPLFTAALIQENSPTIFDSDSDRIERRNIQSWNNYLEETRLAAQAATELDLIVWPESVFTQNEPYFDWDRSRSLPPVLVEKNIDLDYLEKLVASYHRALEYKTSQLFQAVAGDAPGAVRPHLLLGSDVHRIRGTDYDRFNAALWVAPNGKLVDYYAKQHLVMFGEYLPLVGYLPFIDQIYQVVGMQPASAGERAVCFRLDDKALIVPSICFENVLPHVIHRQIRAVERRDESPDVMINITNDGWFRGSSISDHHLANATFACVENRRPMLVAANTGLSAWIDGSGRRIAVAPRLKADFLIAKPERDGRWGLWQAVGDWPMRGIATIVFILWIGSLKTTLLGRSSRFKR